MLSLVCRKAAEEILRLVSPSVCALEGTKLMLQFLSVKFSWIICEVSSYLAETTLKMVKWTIFLCKSSVEMNKMNLTITQWK